MSTILEDKKPVQRKIYALVAVFFIAFIIVVAVNEVLLGSSRHFEKTLINQHARANLGGIMLKKILVVQSNSYAMLTIDDQIDLANNYNSTKNVLQDMSKVLEVLRTGGVYEDILPANFFSNNDILHKVAFSRSGEENVYILEIIDIAPRIIDIEELVDKIHETHMAIITDSKVDVRMKLAQTMNIELMKLESELLRAMESANRIVFDTNQHINGVEKNKLASEHKFGLIRYGIIGLLIILVALFTVRILSQVNLIRAEAKNAYTNLQKEMAGRKEADIRVKKALASTRAIVKKAPFGIIIVGKDRRLIEINDTALNILCFDSKEEILGKPCNKIVCSSPDNQCPLVDNMHAVANAENVMLTKDNRHIPVIKSVIPLELDGEDVLLEGFIDVTEIKEAQDITKRYQTKLEEEIAKRSKALIDANKTLSLEIEERKRTEEDLKQAQSQLLQSEKMASIGQLAAGVAHEINNPIGFIASNLGTLKEYGGDLSDLILKYVEFEEVFKTKEKTDFDSRLKELVNAKEEMDLEFVLGDFDKAISESLEGAERVKKIVSDLMSFSHVDEAAEKEVNLNKGLESTLSIVWNEIKYKAKVEKDYGDIPEVHCFPQQINQVFMNILVNAGHAIKEEGLIKIRSYYDQNNVYVAISDTGAGIEPEHLEKLFEPFFTTKEIGKGTGLGLSMAYNIIKKHHGRIDVESVVGEGTTFTIVLPIKTELEKEILDETPSAEEISI